MKKVIVRIKGGLGNQLFCYAAARRLALVNNAELVIDDVTGFVRDRKFQRQYALDRFSISARKATAAERLEPFERYHRGFKKYLSRGRPFEERRYLEQAGTDFDERLLSLKVRGILYLDGLWQSENYFKDVEEVIRQDLCFKDLPMDDQNQHISEQIFSKNSVALHVRWFDGLGNKSGRNVPYDYYKRAITLIESKLESPYYFLFSDNLKLACDTLDLPIDRTISVCHNKGDKNSWADLWLMSQCQHFIIANSTFSWWGAWLSREKEKVIICPEFKMMKGGRATWNFEGQIPGNWLTI